MNTKRDTQTFIVIDYSPEAIKAFYRKIGNNVKKHAKLKAYRSWNSRIG